jgi:hypothetical protein
MNIADGYQRVLQGVLNHNMNSISQGDWEIYKMLKEATEDDD